MEAGIRVFLDALDQRFEGDDLDETPGRVARAWSEDLVAGYAIDPEAELTWGPVPAGGGPVIVRDVSFTSVCVHHLLPFFGLAQVAYLPGTRQAGLSKIGRVIDAHARRLQTQERLTAAIVNSLEAALEPRRVDGGRSDRVDQARQRAPASLQPLDRLSVLSRAILLYGLPPVVQDVWTVSDGRHPRLFGVPCALHEPVPARMQGWHLWEIVSPHG